VQDYSHTYTTRLLFGSSARDSRATFSAIIINCITHRDMSLDTTSWRMISPVRQSLDLCVPRRCTFLTCLVSQASGLEAFSRYPCRGSVSAFSCRRADRKLKPLLALHSGPIKQVVFLCPSLPLRVGRSNLEEYFTLICIQRLLQPNFATQPCR
jgi:hypothetical protein